MEVFQTLQL